MCLLPQKQISFVILRQYVDVLKEVDFYGSCFLRGEHVHAVSDVVHPHVSLLIVRPLNDKFLILAQLDKLFKQFILVFLSSFYISWTFFY